MQVRSLEEENFLPKIFLNVYQNLQWLWSRREVVNVPITQHAMKMYGGGVVQLHALLVSVLDGVKSLASFSWLLISKEDLLYLPDRRLDGFQTRPGREAKNTAVLPRSRIECSSQCRWPATSSPIYSSSRRLNLLYI